MKRRLFTTLFTVLVLPFFMFGFGSSRSIASKHSAVPSGRQLHLNSNYGKLPLAFEPNLGQTDSQVQFLSRGAGYTLFLTGSGAVLVLHKAQEDSPTGLRSRTPKFGKSFHSKFLPPDVVRLTLSGAQNNLSFQGLEKLPGISNYFIGNDQSKWHTNIPQYAKIQASEVYPGVDMTYYGNQGHLEYDFIVKPGADPSTIRMKVEGADKTEIDAEGNLEISVGGRKVAFRAPALYQENGSNRTPVEGHFIQKGGDEIGFEAKNYDRTKPLVIDPQVDYATYYGGAMPYLYGNSVVTDSAGDAYLTGEVYADSPYTFPTTTGAYQTTAVGTDAYVVELNPTGTALLYATYLGGAVTNTNNADGYSIQLDSSGDIYIAGETSGDYPTTPGAFATSFSGLNTFFISELNPAGNQLLYSTFFGQGTGTQVSYGGLALDSSNNICLAGMTYNGGIPITSNAYQTTYNGGNEGFIAKLKPAGGGASDLLYSTYFGGTVGGDDAINGLTADSSGYLYFVISSAAPLIPTTSGAFQTTNIGSYNNSYFAKFNPVGGGTSDLVYGSYFGATTSPASAYGIAVDGSGNIYLTGTVDTGLPTTSGAYKTYASNNDMFLAKFTPAGGGVSDLLYSTYLGGQGGEMGEAIAVDHSGYAYITGDAWDDATTPPFPTTAGAYQTTFNGTGSQYNAFFSVIDPAGNGTNDLVYSTLLGGADSTTGNGVALDGSGNAFVVGTITTNSSTTPPTFPTTSGSYDPTAPGGILAYVVKFDASDFAVATPTSSPSPTPQLTNTPTNTTTPSVTNSPTSSSTLTATETASSTATNSPSDTPTGTASGTASLTPTSTATSTDTVSATNTPSATSSNTPTATASSTPTDTATNTLVFTVTNTPTASPTDTPTLTTSNTPTSSATQTPTSTTTPTVTSTNSSTPVFTDTATSSPTVTSTGTPTNTSTINNTPVFTSTSTNTPTPATTGVVVGLPYPNPVLGSGPVSIQLQVPVGSTVEWSVFTTAFRKVLDIPNPVSGNNAVLVWNLDDTWGKPVASGLYYLRIQVTGPVKASKVLKILVFR